MTRTCRYCACPLPQRYYRRVCALCAGLDKEAAFTPTPDEIAAAREAIQADWTAQQERSRAGAIESNLTVGDCGFDRRRNGLNFV